MVRLALCSALSDRAADERVALVDHWDWEVPRTKDAVGRPRRPRPRRPGAGRARPTTTWWPSGPSPTCPSVQTSLAGELNAYDVLRNDWVVFTDATLPGRRDASRSTSTTVASRSSTRRGPGEATSRRGDRHDARQRSTWPRLRGDATSSPRTTADDETRRRGEASRPTEEASRDADAIVVLHPAGRLREDLRADGPATSTCSSSTPGPPRSRSARPSSRPSACGSTRSTP